MTAIFTANNASEGEDPVDSVMMTAGEGQFRCAVFGCCGVVVGGGGASGE
jgi:hypothetical protein